MDAEENVKTDCDSHSKLIKNIFQQLAQKLQIAYQQRIQKNTCGFLNTECFYRLLRPLSLHFQ